MGMYITPKKTPQHRNGVAHINKIATKMTGFLPIADRKGIKRVKNRPFCLIIITAYSLTAESREESTNKFYDYRRNEILVYYSYS